MRDIDWARASGANILGFAAGPRRAVGRAFLVDGFRGVGLRIQGMQSLAASPRPGPEALLFACALLAGGGGTTPSRGPWRRRTVRARARPIPQSGDLDLAPANRLGPGHVSSTSRCGHDDPCPGCNKDSATAPACSMWPFCFWATPSFDFAATDSFLFWPFVCWPRRAFVCGPTRDTAWPPTPILRARTDWPAPVFDVATRVNGCLPDGDGHLGEMGNVPNSAILFAAELDRVREERLLIAGELWIGCAAIWFGNGRG